MKFSLITPTFGRPEEVTEFLESLTHQEYTDFEVIVSDGTPGDALRPALKRFEGTTTYPLQLLHVEYLPVSDARNLAARHANGEWMIFLDSDCLIPPGYLQAVDEGLKHQSLDVFGGPDAAHASFTTLQKAISYSMTSFLTTGGIRGREKSTATYYPRGFNMGMRKSVFEQVHGYDETLKCAEDVDLSIRLAATGARMGLIPGAYVYHKRRTSIEKFFKQVYRFGAARLNLARRHPHQLKPTHLFPLVFALGFWGCLLLAPFWSVAQWGEMAFGVYFLLVGIGAAVKEKSVSVGLAAMVTTAVMFTGYGWGFARNVWATYVERKPQGLSF